VEIISDPEAIVRKLRNQISKKWPESLPDNFDNLSIIPTNIPDLDSILPKGGMPTGELIQISGSKSSGKTRFLFKLLSALKSFENLIIYFDLTGEISSQVIKASGLDSKEFVYIKPIGIPGSIRAAEILFRAKEVKYVVFDLVGIKDSISKVLILRLKRTVKKSKGIAFFLTDENSQGFESNLIGLRLRISRVLFSDISDHKSPDLSPCEKLSIAVEKNSFGQEGQSVELMFDE